MVQDPSRRPMVIGIFVWEGYQGLMGRSLLSATWAGNRPVVGK